MGLYDVYSDVQLKVGPCVCETYEIGDKVPIADGVYVGYEGLVVVIGGYFVAVFEKLTTKWGFELTPGVLLEGRNPIIEGMKILMESKEEEK